MMKVFMKLILFLVRHKCRSQAGSMTVGPVLLALKVRMTGIKVDNKVKFKVNRNIRYTPSSALVIAIQLVLSVTWYFDMVTAIVLSSTSLQSAHAPRHL